MTPPLISLSLLALMLGTGACLAAPIVTIGQTSVLTEFNRYRTQFSDDPNNILPWPDPRTAVAQDNMASVSLSAGPGHAGQAEAWTGVQFAWDLQGHTWQEVRDLPVQVTFDFVYEIMADWGEFTGSANAGVTMPGFSNGWYDFIGYAAGQGGARGGHVVQTFASRPSGNPLTVGSLGNLINVSVYAQAHSAEDSGATNTSSSEFSINSITVRFESVPEPATAALLAVGLPGLAVLRRRSSR